MRGVWGMRGWTCGLLDGEVITLESIRANQKRLRALFPVDELPVGGCWLLRCDWPPPTRACGKKTLDEARNGSSWPPSAGVPVIRTSAARNPPELDLERSIQAVGEMLAQLATRRLRRG